MSLIADAFLKQLTLNDGALRGACKDVTEAEARRRHEGRSSIWWIVGHLVEHRAIPLAELGGDRASRFDLSSLFARDTVPREDVASPSLADLIGEFLRFGDLYRALVAASGDAAFMKTRPTPGGLEMPLPLFFHFHETYHLGQLGLLRTWLGKNSLVPPLKK
jgi:hypothetical protein